MEESQVGLVVGRRALLYSVCSVHLVNLAELIKDFVGGLSKA